MKPITAELTNFDTANQNQLTKFAKPVNSTPANQSPHTTTPATNSTPIHPATTDPANLEPTTPATNFTPIRPKFPTTKRPKFPQYTLGTLISLTLGDIALYAKPTTIHTATYALSTALRHLPDAHISAISPDALQSMIHLLRQKLAPSTIHLIISYLNLTFKKAQSLNLITQNPLNFIKKPRLCRPLKAIPPLARIRLLLDSASGELKRFLYIAFYTGARSGEILALDKSDFDLSSSTLSISKNHTRFGLTTPKNHAQRLILLPKNLLEFIKSDFQNLSQTTLFTKDYFALYYEFKKLQKQLGIPPHGLHITRHCYASILLGGKISPTFIAKNLGHSTLKELNQTYSHYFYDKHDQIRLNKALNF